MFDEDFYTGFMGGTDHHFLLHLVFQTNSLIFRLIIVPILIVLNLLTVVSKINFYFFLVQKTANLVTLQNFKASYKFFMNNPTNIFAER